MNEVSNLTCAHCKCLIAQGQQHLTDDFSPVKFQPGHETVFCSRVCALNFGWPEDAYLHERAIHDPMTYDFA